MALLLCASLLLALAGCRGPGPSRPGGSVDLMPLARWAEKAAGGPGPSIRLPAAAGSPLLGPGWTEEAGAIAGPAAAVSDRRHASLYLPLCPATSGRALVRLRLRDPRAAVSGPAAVIVTFNGRKVERLFPGEAWADHLVELPADWFHQGVNELVLSGEPGRTAVIRLDLEFPGPQVHLTAGDTTRRALVSAAPLVIDLAGPLPAGARLDLSLALGSRLSSPASGTGRYRLERLRGDGGWENLIEGEAAPPGKEHDPCRHDGWADRTVPLDRLAGGPLRLRLSSSGPSCAWGSLTLSWPGEGPARGTVAGDGPNLILILADTLRADRLGAGGSAIRLTPSLDALAAESVQFRDTLAQAPSTVPSVSSFFTGRYFNRLINWVDQRGLPPGLPLFAEALAGQGCRTLAVVANPLLLPENGFARGFDEYHHLPGTARRFYGWEELPVHQPAEAVNARFLQRLPALARGRFFAYLHYMDAHDPYPVEGEGGADPRFSGGRLAGQPWEGWLGPATKEIIDHGGSSIVPGDRTMVARSYDNGVRRLDRQLGLLLAQLRRRGLLSHTVVALVADHGEELFEHGLLGHGHTVYQELLEVPALILFPAQVGYPRPAAVSRRVELIDVAATLLEVMGAGLPEGHAGQSLLPLLSGQAGPARDPARFFETRHRFWIEPPLDADLAGVELDGWKLIRDRRSGEERLFHLWNDPGEAVDLVAAQRNKAAELRTGLEAWLNGQQPLEPGSGDAPRSGGEVAQREAEALRALGYMQ